jgi:REP element-mobilizing transposase RayT
MTAFLTFRLWDSLPASVVRAYDEERRILERRVAKEGQTRELRIEVGRLFSERIELALDAGKGSCVLRRRDYADLVLGALRFFDGERYALRAACVMPNHVHVVVTLEGTNALSEVTHSWKSFTANQAQRRFGHQGSQWQDECYDHIVRDDEELFHYVRYTLENPAKAGLTDWPYVHRGAGLRACEGGRYEWE